VKLNNKFKLFYVFIFFNMASLSMGMGDRDFLAKNNEIFGKKEINKKKKRKLSINLEDVLSKDNSEIINNSETEFDLKEELGSNNQDFFIKKGGGNYSERKIIEHKKFLTFFEFEENYNKKNELDSQEFRLVLQEYIRLSRKNIGESSNFIGNKAIDGRFFEFENRDYGCSGVLDVFFGQKIILDDNSKIAMHADIHADLDALLELVQDFINKGHLDKSNPFKIKDKNLKIFFLGDYVDRGDNSFEVVYFLMRIFIENPGQVFLLRGNHENVSENIDFNFASKVIDSIGNFDNISKFYNTLPSFVFAGVKEDGGNKINYILFTHGGLEPRFNPHLLLSDSRSSVFQIIDKLDLSWLKRRNGCDNIFEKFRKFYGDRISNIILSRDLGFMWSDFIIEKLGLINNNYIEYSERGIGSFSFCHSATLDLLKAYSSENYKVVSIFRGHQHHGMRFLLANCYGIYNSWIKNNGLKKEEDVDKLEFTLNEEFPVWTLGMPVRGQIKLVKYMLNTYAILNLSGEFKDWKLNGFNCKRVIKTN